MIPGPRGGSEPVYQQSTSYECGPYALKHALKMLGVFVDERRLGRLAGTTPAGTDEVQLARAADRVGCDLPLLRAFDPARARELLTAQLARGIPSLLCVDQWDHWIAVVGGDGERFAILDSAVPAVAVPIDWEKLAARWAYRDVPGRAAAPAFYDLHPVLPRGKTPGRARIGADAASTLARPERSTLVRDWSAFARPLLALAAPAAPGNGEPTVVDLSRLLLECRDRLLDRAVGRTEVHRAAAARVLEEMRLVSHLYGLRVLREKSRPVLDGVAELLRDLTE
ncbi:MAG TPA: cysteine peptidase family C39 domain-containing protein [Gemmatimonadales bacterium]|nr:cysteine peptidase family C39 domain-containing protein [Gemmatimonadales bacterium]